MNSFAELTYKNKYAIHKDETWPQVAWRVATNTFSKVDAPRSLVESAAKEIEARKLMPAGRYLYACGRPIHQTNNCMTFKAADSREGWSELLHKASMSLMTGAGIGVVYSDVRGEGELIRGTGGLATGPLALMQILNEMGRGIMQGGSRRSAMWAGLRWDHADIEKFVKMKNWSEEIRELKAKDYNFPAIMDMTNISVCLNDEFFEAYHNKGHEKHVLASKVYWMTVERMLRTSEPGFSVDVGENAGEDQRNACGEFTSRENNNVCNLISPNMSRITSHQEMARLCRLASAFTVAGSVYSDLPCEEARATRDKCRQIGVGVMGLHEWLLQRGKPYGPDDELESYLKIYEESTDYAAKEWADTWKLSRPIKRRAIAPTGTISIVAGPTTSGIEPMLCVAYIRRFLVGQVWEEEYVIEPIAQKLIDEGMAPEDIEDAYSIDPEMRLKFQAWVQQYVDMGISSTINLPAWGSEKNNKQTVQRYGNLFLKYLPKLRGLTCYADGSRSGQPLVPVPYEEALKHKAIREVGDVCILTKGGASCGD